MDEADDAAVYGRHRRRAGVGPAEREAAEEKDRRVRGEAWHQRVNDLRVADELEGHELRGGGDVVGRDCVGVTLDRTEHQARNGADVPKALRDACR